MGEDGKQCCLSVGVSWRYLPGATRGADPNNGEPVCSGGMLYLSCGTDKNLHVSACLSVALEPGGVEVSQGGQLLLRDTTQIGKKHRKHTLRPCHSTPHSRWNMFLYCNVETCSGEFESVSSETTSTYSGLLGTLASYEAARLFYFAKMS